MMEEDKHETPFIFRSPFPRPKQRDTAIKQNVASIQRDLQFIQSHGYDEFMQRQNDARGEAAAGSSYGGGANDDTIDATEEENLGSSFEGSLRDYQIYMLERAKKENAIVHLGTG